MFVVKPVVFDPDQQCVAFVGGLHVYSIDPMGGGQGLSDGVKSRLSLDLPNWPGAVNLLAWQDEVAIGLLNAFTGYSTFKAQPLINIHDIAVLPEHRGTGVGRALLSELQTIAKERGCFKLTLEVLSGNTTAVQTYQKFGFEDYALDPKQGAAQFMQKWL
mgnify:CR=1 FL=1